MPIIIRKLNQPFLPGEFQPPPPACPVRPGEHNWVTPPEKELMLTYLPPSGRNIFCSYCAVTRPPKTEKPA